jgi:hypothetical protein
VTERAVWIVLATAVLAATACGDGTQVPHTDAGADGPAGPAFRTSLVTPDDFAAVADPDGELKYVAPVAGRAPVPPLTQPCYFQDMRRTTWHLAFLQSFPELASLTYDSYLALVMREGSRQLWAGTLKLWPTAVHPRTKAPGVLTYEIYGEPDSVNAAAIREVDGVLKACAPFAREQLVFLAVTVDQGLVVLGHREQLAAQGVTAVLREELPGGGSSP